MVTGKTIDKLFYGFNLVALITQEENHHVNEKKQKNCKWTVKYLTFSSASGYRQLAKYLSSSKYASVKDTLVLQISDSFLRFIIK